MCWEELAHIATVIGVCVALIVYITNSYFQYKQRISENALKYMKFHDDIFHNEFIVNNIKAMEVGTFRRDLSDEKSELSFNRLLGQIEKLALLTNNRIVSKTANVYMFGWFARHIQPVLTTEERNNIYWELAVKFLDELKKEADDFYKLSKDERDKYFRKKHFFH